MTILDSIILGIVEGLTEFLPVSSTGHLLLVNSLLGLQSAASDSFAIVIQLGAILAVAVYYRHRLFDTFATASKTGSGGQRLLLNLFIAFLPAAVVGLLFDDLIEEKLMRSDAWIAAALMIGGIVMIVVERWFRPAGSQREELDQVSFKDALLVGIAQCFALWPGMSRSMVTIVGGQMRGFSNNLAADFSFLLALPTLGAATLYKMVKDREALMAMEGGWLTVAVGLIVSFVVAWLAIAIFLRLIKHVGMTPFGIYRIIIGGVVFWVLYN